MVFANSKPNMTTARKASQGKGQCVLNWLMRPFRARKLLPQNRHQLVGGIFRFFSAFSFSQVALKRCGSECRAPLSIKFGLSNANFSMWWQLFVHYLLVRQRVVLEFWESVILKMWLVQRACALRMVEIILGNCALSSNSVFEILSCQRILRMLQRQQRWNC